MFVGSSLRRLIEAFARQLGRKRQVYDGAVKAELLPRVSIIEDRRRGASDQESRDHFFQGGL